MSSKDNRGNRFSYQSAMARTWIIKNAPEVWEKIKAESERRYPKKLSRAQLAIKRLGV